MITFVIVQLIRLNCCACLESNAGLAPTATLADVGSGTGISAKLFLDNGNTVYGVEPNRDMRAAAEKFLHGNARFHSVDGSAEQTTLSDRSVDFIVAGQAFHWFDQPKARQEFARILKPGGWVMLMWNSRHIGTTPFLCDYEGLLREFAIDYTQVDHKRVDDVGDQAVFRPGHVPIPQLAKFSIAGSARADRANYLQFVPAGRRPFALSGHAVRDRKNL